MVVLIIHVNCHGIIVNIARKIKYKYIVWKTDSLTTIFLLLTMSSAVDNVFYFQSMIKLYAFICEYLEFCLFVLFLEFISNIACKCIIK